MKKKKRKFLDTVYGFIERVRTDHVGAYAAQSAYFMILSFIPFILCLLAVVRYTFLSKSMIQEALIQIFPANLESFVIGIIDEIYAKSSAVIPITVLSTLWSAGKGLQAVINGLNCIYHVKETRNWLVTRIYSILYTVILMIALLLSLVLLVFGNSLQSLLAAYAPLLARLVKRFMEARTILVLCVLVAVFGLLFQVLPNRKASFRSQIPGAVLTAVSWLTFSYGFSLYFTWFPSSFTNMYGSMATVVIVMLWLYICMNIVFYGALFNSYFER